MMDGSCFTQHRSKLLEMFRTNFNVTSGIIFYESPDQPKEPYSNSELPFLQEALFYWVSGWSNPDSAITIDIESGHTILYIPSYDEHYEIWTGPIPTNQSIIDQTGVNEVRFTKQYLDDVMSYVQKKIKLYSSSASNKNSMKCDNEIFVQAAGMARIEKLPHEISNIRTAAEKTGKALVESMKNCKPGLHEYDIETMFEYYGARLGCRNVSFKTIVGSGQHAVYLHYTANDGLIKDGDLVLVDCGLFENHYAGDITRTFPASGKFSPDQALVYNLLLEKQIELIRMVKPGLTFQQLNGEMFKSIMAILESLGIASSEGLDKEKMLTVARLFCPHSLTHNVGCNVHDLVYNTTEKDKWKASTLLRPGMVITAEPGIYFHKVRLERERNNPNYACVNFDKALHYADTVGGIRIEDDLLVTEDGSEVLSCNCPKTIEEIEKIMSSTN
ncbi:Clan MG, family M24, aminopeptidase P-like metallopeptidase [Histomonas meleagridis]|uniref:Clan MG, family M24, aminopeptidase P-like metallopeptidase n=1 Tax=Histomonas meleagridis TaxID=135588 RepID=UPI00355A7EA8|nr:Clan MG, family M24, aminopeptidase P-like metallopeptidase [Histomonas meleagridis]KAH0801744.1 Clan MG, family M24, aminopeptidase P-like metallopeptidase [Histomonas meleagridis]